MSHIKIMKDSKHAGYMNKSLHNALKDLEPIFGEEIINNTMDKLVRNIHGDGEIIMNNRKVGNGEVSSEELLEIMSGLVNKNEEKKKKIGGSKKVKKEAIIE